jgi:hypothetical protein
MKKGRRNHQKKSAGGSVYAQLRQPTELPRCSECSKGFVTLKVITVNGKVQQLCPACIRKVLPEADERRVPQ